jgi:hypothetical protein
VTPGERERERAALLDIALLAELDKDEPMTEGQRLRVLAIAMADIADVENDRTSHGVIDRELKAQFSTLFAVSGITDAKPGSMTSDANGGVHVWSSTLGQVRIGTIDFRRLLASVAEYTERLEADEHREAGLGKGRAAQLSEADRKRSEVVRLAGLGLTQGQVKLKTGFSRKTVTATGRARVLASRLRWESGPWWQPVQSCTP